MHREELSGMKNLFIKKKSNEEWGEPVDFDLLTKTKELQTSERDIKTYPNPVSNTISIKNDAIDKPLESIQLFNSAGEKLADWPCNGQTEITQYVGHIPSGSYWLLVKDIHGKVWRQRFVKH